MPPKCKIYPLSLPESKAMEDYIEEALAAGGLNAITVCYPSPLPLVPVALEQLREARVFTKVNLRSTYNLVCIREGDQWKTTFHNTRGHYEYLVMPYGLTNAPAVLQAFINEIFKDLIDQYIITCIDDILIYSVFYDDHVHHVRLGGVATMAGGGATPVPGADGLSQPQIPLRCQVTEPTASLVGTVLYAGPVLS
ncbi:hypothetical protein QTP70_008987 [Hemibagrus guttatus]|uniref:ribonuclease H n=1 Tax=Hemibagrus guttatus TaxID=175788 RepID=A0AAE0Q0J6_9TELE|nr:hypothetical protein QTP70_008987 [Hemibagrus guttatus]KAK3531971.1 hypothetical protein QTP86_002285 [Hemibagrus guttatus]